MADVFIMTDVNLFCGDIDPTQSTHLEIADLKLPGLEENYVDHLAGGAPVGVEVDTHIARLEATFNLLGWNPYVMTIIGSSNASQQSFTAFGVVRNRRTGMPMEAKALMNGRMGRVNPQPWRRGDAQHHEYAIRSIMHYELYLDGTEIYNWDFFLNTRRIGGIDQNYDVNRILRIPISV